MFDHGGQKVIHLVGARVEGPPEDTLGSVWRCGLPMPFEPCAHQTRLALTVEPAYAENPDPVGPPSLLHDMELPLPAHKHAKVFRDGLNGPADRHNGSG